MLIYNHNRQAFELMIRDLPEIFKKADVDQNLELSDEEINNVLFELKEKYFKYCNDFMFREEDLIDILKYYSEKSIEPPFFEFKDRENFDVGKLVLEAVEKDYGTKKLGEFLREAWIKEPSFYRLYFGNNFSFFVNEFDLELRKVRNPEFFIKEKISPSVKYGEIDINKLPLNQIKVINPSLYKKISDAVYQKYTDKDGYFFSAIGNFKSEFKMHFQIDHIKPISKGGLTEVENLQLVTRWENMEKGNTF